MEFSLKLQEKTAKSYLSYSSIKHALTDMRLRVVHGRQAEEGSLLP